MTLATLSLQTQVRIAAQPVRYFVKRDWERDDYLGYITRPNMPCVFRCGELGATQNGHYTRLDEEWQFFMFDVTSLSVFGRLHDDLTALEYDWLAQKFTSVFDDGRAFNNNHGFDVFRNYITGERMNAELPAIYTIACGGASLGGEVVGNYLKVAHFDGNGHPPDPSTIFPYTDPRVFFATTITDTKDGLGGYRVRRFPQYDGRDVPVPLIASTDIYYPLADLEEYTGAKRSPYN